jgi:hypothetical protein
MHPKDAHNFFIRLFRKVLQNKYKDQYKATIPATLAKPTRLMKGVTKSRANFFDLAPKHIIINRRPRQVAQQRGGCTNRSNRPSARAIARKPKSAPPSSSDLSPEQESMHQSCQTCHRHHHDQSWQMRRTPAVSRIAARATPP